MNKDFITNYEGFYQEQKIALEEPLKKVGGSAFQMGLEIHELTMRHPVLTHPFYQDFYEGKLTLEQMRAFLIYYYQHILHTRHYYQMMMAIATPLIVRGDFDREFHDNLMDIQSVFSLINNDEYNDGEFDNTHMGMFEKLMGAFGIPVEDRLAMPIDEVKEYIAIHYGMSLDFYSGVGAVGPGSEWPVPPIFSYFLEGAGRVAKENGITLTEDDVIILTGHIELDVHHAIWVISHICRYDTNPAAREKIMDGLIISLNARYNMMSGIGNRMYGDDRYGTIDTLDMDETYRQALTKAKAFKEKGASLFLSSN